MDASSAGSEYRVAPVGWVRSPRREVTDDEWGDVVAEIEIAARYVPEALRGLDGFSHLEVLYLFDRVAEEDVEVGARRPRNNPAWPEVGVFAQRNRRRPNRIGVSVCQLVALDGGTLTVRGLDAVDGTPVLDIKPYVAEFAPRGEVRQPAWSHELLSRYW
ncbi:MAG TPA: tRNA (N6-threonylcarbamoyladenosine(37)-N6)-methyltransferase TrmO [Solirubrobacteraceae bacterium]|nr:tRNA (N6-threonylcarbamoyladenosine(37)-N6)-methyltransferase TrmO [Solirubrobacteraceae bacterium]